MPMNPIKYWIRAEVTVRSASTPDAEALAIVPIRRGVVVAKPISDFAHVDKLAGGLLAEFAQEHKTPIECVEISIDGWQRLEDESLILRT